MKKFNIDTAASEEMTLEDVTVFIDQNQDGFIFQKVIERAHHYSDLAEYYLEASYICEKIAVLGQSSSFEVDWHSGYHPVAQFVFVPENDELTPVLYEFIIALSGNDDEVTDWWIDNIEVYKKEIETQQLQFPELADDYFANLINGAYGEYESNYEDPEEFQDGISKRNPEHLFGFWKCMLSGKLKQDFFVSAESWIIPPQSDLVEILNKYSSIENIILDDGNIFSLNGSHYVVNDNYVLAIDFPALAKAVQCISRVFNEERTLYEQHDWLYHLSKNYNVQISDFANFILFIFNEHKIVLWNQDKLTFNDISSLNRNAADIFKITSDLIGLKEHISCPWVELNDESFEQLCYDIIYYDPIYDNRTIRKMGKSKSRDGGRDIEVHTHGRLGYKPEKFIFQCKLLKPGISLTATKVLDISDIIEQFEADGYGIFTSGVIDATLYNKIDAIAKRKHIKTELSSKHELERILARLPIIKARYFKLNQEQNG